MKSFFRPKEARQIINALLELAFIKLGFEGEELKKKVRERQLSYRMLWYWDETQFISPSYRRHKKYRLYVFFDLVLLWTISDLKLVREHSLQELREFIRDIKKVLPEHIHPTMELTLLIEGERVLVFNGLLPLDAATQEQFLRFDTSDLHQQITTQYPRG